MLVVFFKTACIFLISVAGFVLRRRGIIDTAFNRQRGQECFYLTRPKSRGYYLP